MTLYDSTPYIKIGNGTSNFYINLCKSYLNNHEQVYVIGGGYKIHTALWVYVGLQENFCVSDIQHICLSYVRMHSMCRFTVKKGKTKPIIFVDNFDNDVNIKPSHNISELTHKCHFKLKDTTNIDIVGVGSCCVKAFFVASQLVQKGYFSYVYPVNILSNDRFVIKINIYKPF